MKVQCQICYEWIAVVDPKDFKLPMMGSMFKSIDPHHGIPDPFPPNLDWEFLKCPWGLHRPFINPNQIMTDEGLITIKERVSPSSKVIFQANDGDPVTPPEGAKAYYQGSDGNLYEIEGDKTIRVGQNLKPISTPPVTGVKIIEKGEKYEEESKKGFTCETCGKDFEKEINLKRHIYAAHKKVRKR